MAWFPCKIGGGGGPSGITITFYKRIIEQGWDSVGSITYTFDENISDCILVLTYTRETSLSNTQYTLTLASGSYEEMEDSGVVIGSTTQERVVYLNVHDIKIGDTLYMYNYGDLKTADILKYRQIPYGNATVKQGTFVSASSQFGIVDVNCGFEPDLVMVRLPFGNNDTVSYWEKDMSWAETTAFWNLQPSESVTYLVALGRASGETGIQAINNNGFSFMSNGGNTQGVTCEYVAVKYKAEPQTDDRTYLFKDGEWKNQDILSLYGYNTTIENGSLKCTGAHAGVVVDDVSGLDSSVTQYSVYLKVRAGNVNSYPLQTGRNVPTQNLYDIIQYGTDRYSYNTDYISSGTDYLFILIALYNTDGVFLGAQNSDENAYYYIDEIWLETSAQVIVHS